ncbi:hypothetical protein J3Q64DRAFT_1701280 [Phycomyces blakesleeanus]|uniref:Uncharacterized protein n=2 Tax=Phycomyces blakesleeanus TaxID=4837 RepID=A0A162QAL6_PHYB8|nr:hypothetical protein PHYBLDRAFT_162067 [Phycomyces blakesleeanus NRRL 1555(-)]OAD81456.1 hypothetical protein PHYBLDRAFT_162067 [Phycomyces blakesleeanus NRRL 1555(-)]|eukprot:XP_018299496.1 hypothetical protein PHYBLDRAFT_162067 [Phycomyces blakesleeanus NRRL 1555(-)]
MGTSSGSGSGGYGGYGGYGGVRCIQDNLNGEIVFFKRGHFLGRLIVSFYSILVFFQYCHGYWTNRNKYDKDVMKDLRTKYSYDGPVHQLNFFLKFWCGNLGATPKDKIK